MKKLLNIFTFCGVISLQCWLGIFVFLGIVSCGPDQRPNLSVYEVTFEHTNDTRIGRTDGRGAVNHHALRRFEVYAKNAGEARQVIVKAWLRDHNEMPRKIKVKKL